MTTATRCTFTRIIFVLFIFILLVFINSYIFMFIYTLYISNICITCWDMKLSVFECNFSVKYVKNVGWP